MDSVELVRKSQNVAFKCLSFQCLSLRTVPWGTRNFRVRTRNFREGTRNFREGTRNYLVRTRNYRVRTLSRGNAKLSLGNAKLSRSNAKLSRGNAKLWFEIYFAHVLDASVSFGFWFIDRLFHWFSQPPKKLHYIFYYILVTASLFINTLFAA